MFHNIDWALTAKGTIYTILALFLAYLYLQFVLWVAERLHQMDVKAQEEQAERCRRLAILSAIADEVETLPDGPDRRRLYREAEALGFLDSDDLPRMQA